MKSLLMATDLSARSDRALERAVDLARDHGAQLTIVHIVDESLPLVMIDSQEKAAEQLIREYIDSLNTDNSTDLSTKISIEVVLGLAHADILETAEKLEAELIILGMHREEAFNDLFRGTTAERVIRVGNLPVLLVKERMTNPYRRVTVGVDFSVYSRRAMEFAVGLVPKAEFYLVHAYHVPFKGILRDRQIKKEIAKEQEKQMTRMVEQEMALFLSSLGSDAPELERIIKDGTPQEVIGRQIDRLGSDLLVVGTHGRTGMAHAILGSVAENYLRKPPCDVLAVQAF